MSSTRNFLTALKRSRMYFYYLGIIIAGVVGFVAEPARGVVHSLGLDASIWVFSSGMVILGCLAILSRKLGLPRAEGNIMIGIALATAVHGITILTLGETGWQSGSRLAIAAMMMWDWADYRKNKDWEVLIHRASSRIAEDEERG